MLLEIWPNKNKHQSIQKYKYIRLLIAALLLIEKQNKTGRRKEGWKKRWRVKERMNEPMCSSAAEELNKQHIIKLCEGLKIYKAELYILTWKDTDVQNLLRKTTDYNKAREI